MKTTENIKRRKTDKYPSLLLTPSVCAAFRTVFAASGTTLANTGPEASHS
jgi:hypothetical protein